MNCREAIVVTQEHKSEGIFCMGTEVVIVQCIMYGKELTLSKGHTVSSSLSFLFFFLPPASKQQYNYYILKDQFINICQPPWHWYSAEKQPDFDCDCSVS